jgi:HEAT repeat protein
LYKIVRHAGRPGAKKEAQAVETELIPLLKSGAVSIRREVLWMLSEIGDEDAIAPMAALLTDKEVREDARCALMRLPGRKATAALKSAFSSAPEEFRSALAESLRARGEKVSGYPSQKLVPTRSTTVGQPKPA